MRHVSLKAIIRTMLLSLSAYKQAGTGRVPVVAHLNSLLTDRHAKIVTYDINIQVWCSSLSAQGQCRGNQIHKVASFSSACWFSLHQNTWSRFGDQVGKISASLSTFRWLKLKVSYCTSWGCRTGGRWRRQGHPTPPVSYRCLSHTAALICLWSSKSLTERVVSLLLMTCIWKKPQCWLSFFFFFQAVRLALTSWCAITWATSFITSRPHPDSLLSLLSY